MPIEPSIAQLFLSMLNNARRVLIGTHLNPDGDALGSALALSLFLDQMEIEHEVLCHNLPPENLRFLPEVHKVKQEPALTGFDLAVVLDLDSLERLGSTQPYFEACPRLIVIDHHQPHEEPGDLRIVDSHSPATALTLTELLQMSGANITGDMATCLLTGIVTDTGSFRFRNTTPESLAISAQLLQLGGNLVQISEEIYQRKPFASVKLLGHCITHMKLACEARIAWTSVSVDDFTALEANDEHTEGVVNELLSIETVCVAAILREAKPGRIRASLRSRGDFDVAKVARQFNGGGHRNAAGCNFMGSLADVEEKLIGALKECLGC